MILQAAIALLIGVFIGLIALVSATVVAAVVLSGWISQRERVNE